jgi:hypothetical protein
VALLIRSLETDEDGTPIPDRVLSEVRVHASLSDLSSAIRQLNRELRANR